MPDFAAQRFNMVESQVRTSDVPDQRLQDAMLAVPRERFVPVLKRGFAYAEVPVEIVPGRFMMEARTLAKLLHAARIAGGDKALVVGGMTGYSAAILSHICSSVTLLESDADLVRAASEMLPALGNGAVTVAQGGLSDGHKPGAPYDLILIDGGVEDVPATLFAQLAEGGRLAAVIMGKNGLGRAHIYVKSGQAIGDRPDFDAFAPMLPGFRTPEAFVF